MILQALTAYYEALVERGEAERPGWSPMKVTYALYLGDDGELQDIVNLMVEQPRGGKMKLAPQEMRVPMPVKRSSGVAANFLCDNSSYILGIDDKGKPKRSKECFKAAGELHREVLEGVDSPAARAVVGFFAKWDPDTARENPEVAGVLPQILINANIVFRHNGMYAHEDVKIREAWNRAYSEEAGGEKAICLVTGEETTPAVLHPSIKGIVGAQSSGASLVSFNTAAACSYGKEQGLNAPTGSYAAFAYGTALNYLTAHRKHVSRIGDTSVICWASNANPGYASFMNALGFGAASSYAENDLLELARDICRGRMVVFEEEKLSAEQDFYILGLAPNAARLSVRFFLHNTFGNFLHNILLHYERMEIVRPAFDAREYLSLWQMMGETVNQNSRDKEPSHQMVGETLRAILMNSRYPATLLNGVMLRIRAEQDIKRGKAAIIKAYYLKNRHPDVPEEVLQMALNEQSTNCAYTLGRLFSVLEDIQQQSYRVMNPGGKLNTTIRDKYFSSASATPGAVFPTLVNLTQKHLKKLDERAQNKYGKKLGALMDVLGENYPVRMSLAEQGSFQLGYYQQTQTRYIKKEDNIDE